MIIALPESFTEYYPRCYVLALFTDHFKERYGVECIAALHHNKRKTNFHIHLIFSERKKLEEPVVKVASRNMFYDERGVHVRAKKQILDENGEIRPGCSVIKKGEIYEKKLFETKNGWFKTAAFLDEVKHSYTELINQEVPDKMQKLQVFERGSLYLPTKKIGKNNPKAEEIAKDNEMRQEWNATVDQALVSGVVEEEIREIKRECISEEIKVSIDKRGRRPELFFLYLFDAVFKLKELIDKVRERVAEAKEERLEFPVRSPLAAKYQQLESIQRKLDDQNEAIFNRELELGRVRNELACATGIFKRKERKNLQEQVDSLEHQVASMNMKQFRSLCRNIRRPEKSIKRIWLRWKNGGSGQKRKGLWICRSGRQRRGQRPRKNTEVIIVAAEEPGSEKSLRRAFLGDFILPGNPVKRNNQLQRF